MLHHWCTLHCRHLVRVYLSSIQPCCRYLYIMTLSTTARYNFASFIAIHYILCLFIWRWIYVPPPSLVLLQHFQPWWAEQKLGWWFITGRVLSIQMRGYNQQWGLLCVFLLCFASPVGTFLRPACNPLQPWWWALWWCSTVETPLTGTGSERNLLLTECEVLLACTYAKLLLFWWPLSMRFISQASEEFKQRLKEK